jgi:Predicted hydrolases or acyltransferases (alpha/beta hydrolase superfamily)
MLITGMQALRKGLSKNLNHQSQFFFAAKPAKLNYVVSQSTNPDSKLNLIVLHGLLGSHANFKNICKNDKIAKYATSYLVDLRNHGDSEHKETMTDAEMAEDVITLIKEKNLDSKGTVIMGHSMGARVAMSLAQLYPQLPTGVIIVDYAPYNYYSDPRFQVVKRTKEMIGKMTQLTLGADINEIKKNISQIATSKDVAGLLLTNIAPDGHGGFKWKVNLRAILKRYDELMGCNWEDSKKYSGPVRVICGEKSEYMTMDILHTFNQVFTNFNANKDLILIKDAGHWVHFNKPYDFIDNVSSFLQELSK